MTEFNFTYKIEEDLKLVLTTRINDKGMCNTNSYQSSTINEMLFISVTQLIDDGYGLYLVRRLLAKFGEILYMAGVSFENICVVTVSLLDDVLGEL